MSVEDSIAMPGSDGKDRSHKKMTISELAAEFGVTPRAIRYYEEVGLLKPHRNTPKSQRLYDERDRARLKLILRGKRFGYSLNELVDILELYEVDPTQGQQIMRTLEYGLQHIREIDERIEELQEIRQEMLEFGSSFLEILERQGEEDGFLSLARAMVIKMGEKGGSPTIARRDTPRGIRDDGRDAG
jgi:DNA-binding transcriptional MerR regulator